MYTGAVDSSGTISLRHKDGAIEEAVSLSSGTSDDHNNPASWSPDFVTTMATNLAKWVGPAVSSSEGNTRLAEMRTDKAIRGAKAVNGQENRPQRIEFSRLMARRRRMSSGSIRTR
jgi:hypothetical protein